MHHLVGSPDEAEDLAQEVFLRVYRTRKKYTPKAKFSTWLFTIANNLALNALRDRQRRPILPLEVHDCGPLGPRPTETTTPSRDEPPTHNLQQQELAAVIRRALDGLNERQRVAIVLNKFEDMNYAEIADVMGLTTKAVKSLLSRARAKLREVFRVTSTWTPSRRPNERMGQPSNVSPGQAWLARFLMSDEPMSLPDDDSSPADPFESELVAYLDGELDPVAARKVEVRLATDPAARERATALKKTFALLDYLPKPEPSPTFTTRTLDKIPALKSGSIPVVVQSQTVRTQPKSQSTVTSSPAMVSSSVPVTLTSGALSARAGAALALCGRRSSWRLSGSEDSVFSARRRCGRTCSQRPGSVTRAPTSFRSPITG